MRKLRAAVRLLGILTVTFVCLFYLALRHLFSFAGTEARARIRAGVMRFWAGKVARIIGMQIVVKGKPPAPPFLLVSNHLSYLDILPFWQELDTTFIAKGEIRHWPVIGSIAQFLGILFIERTKKRDLQRVNQIIREHISSTQGVVLFPEGTSSAGDSVLPFKSSLLYYPASEEVPVHYAAISYHLSDDVPFNAAEHVCWWGDMEFVTHFWTLLQIRSSKAVVHFGDAPIQSNDRKELTSRLEEEVNHLFTPTTG